MENREDSRSRHRQRRRSSSSHEARNATLVQQVGSVVAEALRNSAVQAEASRSSAVQQAIALPAALATSMPHDLATRLIQSVTRAEAAARTAARMARAASEAFEEEAHQLVPWSQRRILSGIFYIYINS